MKELKVDPGQLGWWPDQGALGRSIVRGLRGVFLCVANFRASIKLAKEFSATTQTQPLSPGQLLTRPDSLYAKWQHELSATTVSSLRYLPVWQIIVMLRGVSFNLPWAYLSQTDWSTQLNPYSSTPFLAVQFLVPTTNTTNSALLGFACISTST
jgi:hypothetical protein